MPKIDRKTGLITTGDNYQIYFHGNEIEVKKDNKTFSFVYERLVGGSIVIFKGDNSDFTNQFLRVLDETLKEMGFSYEFM